MTDRTENHSASQGSGEGSAADTESARSQREAFERLCEKIQSAMSGSRPWRPEYCMPPDYCPPPFGPHHHHYCGPPHHYCGPPPYYYGPPPSLSLLNHLFQFAGSRAYFWHRWFESLAGTGRPHHWHDPCCHGYWHDPCYRKHDPCCELPDCDEFKEMKGALKEFISGLDEDHRKKYEPVIGEMIHCVAMMRRMDAVRRRSYGDRRRVSAGPEWN